MHKYAYFRFLTNSTTQFGCQPSIYMLPHPLSNPYHTPRIGLLKVPRKVEKGAKKSRKKLLGEKTKNLKKCLELSETPRKVIF